MSRVITFSRYFPAAHPKKGQPTYFVEKVLSSLDIAPAAFKDEASLIIDTFGYFNNDYEPKYHTIRAGSRWKVGDKFSPRVWSGKPYSSKQIIIAPDIEVKKIFDLRLQFISRPFVTFKNDKGYNQSYPEGTLLQMAKNDGFDNSDDLESWLLNGKGWDPVFEGQIICWNENINY